MSVWLACAAALLVGVGGCGVACCRGERPHRFVALQLCTVVSILALLVLASVLGRSALMDVALMLALLNAAAAYAFAHFMEGDL